MRLARKRSAQVGNDMTGGKYCINIFILLLYPHPLSCSFVMASPVSNKKLRIKIDSEYRYGCSRGWSRSGSIIQDGRYVLTPTFTIPTSRCGNIIIILRLFFYHTSQLLYD